MRKTLSLLVVIVSLVLPGICFADPTTPYLSLEKDIFFHPAQFMEKVNKRYNELHYAMISPDLPARTDTLLRLKALMIKIQDEQEKKAVNPTDEQFELTWKKESTVTLLTNLYYWLHGPKNPVKDDGIDDAWYLVSTNIAGFEKSLSHLTKKERDTEK